MLILFNRIYHMLEGLLSVKRSPNMAEAYDVAVAFHCPLGPIALAACLQLDAVVHNAFIQEQSLGIHYNDGNDLMDYIKNPEIFEYEDGYVKIPQLPGLGVIVDEELVIEKSKSLIIGITPFGDMKTEVSRGVVDEYMIKDIITIDVGTTNTRVSLWEDEELQEVFVYSQGVQKASLAGNNDAVKNFGVFNQKIVQKYNILAEKTVIIASGMITSALDLLRFLI